MSLFSNESKSYFRARSATFWMCIAYCVFVAVIMGGMAIVAPETFLEHFVLFNENIDDSTIALTRIRGSVILVVTVGCLAALAMRSPVLRHGLLLSAVVVGFLYFLDLYNLIATESVLEAAGSQGFLIFLFARPLGFVCFYLISRDLQRSRHLESSLRFW